MTKRYCWRELTDERRARILRRPAANNEVVRESAAAIVREVRSSGDSALYTYAARFDGARLETLSVSAKEREAALSTVATETRAAMERAVENITSFHQQQKRPAIAIETQPGVRCERVVRPIARVGLYAPGGSAPLASTVLMLGVPARLAGCTLRVLCTPPRKDGSIDPHVLVAATLTGISSIYKVGGAQAIAAMAYGTVSVPKVDKIYGPGNAWVTAAKQIVAEDADGAAIDMPAGPSEVLVIADTTADPALVASDLLSQAEHGPDSQVVLVTTSPTLADKVLASIEDELPKLPRATVARQSLEHSLIIEATDENEAVAIANQYAPEHLVLQTATARSLVSAITSAGSVFVGRWSPESVGDYASGTNHVLPTYGYARAFSGLSLESFEKTITVQELSPEGLLGIANTVETLAAIEGLDAHRLAVVLRREKLARNTAAVVASKEPTAPGVWIDQLARPAVRNLKPYSSARSMVTQAPILLDANENPWTPLEARPGLNRYPSPQPQELVARLRQIYGAAEGSLIIGRGTDDVIDWLLRAFCEARQDSVLICPPTYGVYSVFAELQGAGVRAVPLHSAPSFAVDTEAVLSAWQPNDKLVFLCSPNNPTGNTVEPTVLLTLADALAGRALLVVDEAYIEFADTESLADKVASLENLVVLRTLSKAYGLAGARCGVGIAHPKVVSLLNKVRAPYPLARPAIEAVLEATDDHGQQRMRDHVATLKGERQRMHDALRSQRTVRHVFDSQANFILAQFTNATRVLAACRAAGIIVRDRSSDLGLDGCIRISLGTPEENTRLLATLKSSGK